MMARFETFAFSFIATAAGLLTFATMAPFA